ncbi:BON domain-containing protein [Salinispirillum sp. LH 10-3-1]|uniref:BON domain-containing protein n=1 Tax=Salinispirillum sp. LH 10-3-1 TaxID=2952525 RepID=A0AB38YFP5_9GAMM
MFVLSTLFAHPAVRVKQLAVLAVLCFMVLPAVADDDARLQGRIEAALILSESLNGYVFEVAVSDQRVVISGAVTNENERRVILQVARSVAGDLEVESDVELSTAQPATTDAMVAQRTLLQGWHRAQLEAELRREFAESSALDGLNINIDIQDDTLILTGTVSSELERMVANQLGQNLDSIQVVNNQLTVEE